MDIKFQFLYKGLPFHSGTKDCNWHKKVYSLDQLLATKISNLSDVHNQSTLVAKRQFTGLKDRNGVEIYVGDLIKNDHGRTAKVAWHNLSASFDCNFVSDDGSANDYEDKSYGFHNCDWKRYVEVIGNIYQNPELIENNN
jgi:uncharacterized phage protein (TIGR01671 family)